MQCQRCSSLRGEQAVARIRSEIIDLAVCGQCAQEAWELGLGYELLPEPSATTGAERIAAAA